MNDLSWLLYWADVLPALAEGLAWISGIGAALSLIGVVVHIIAVCDKTAPDEIRSGLRFTRWLAPLLLALALSTNLVPSRETFYAIAASELGEEVLKTPEIGKARQALNKWLDEQLQPEEVVPAH